MQTPSFSPRAWNSSETAGATRLARSEPEGNNMANAANNYVYFFGKGKADGKSDMRALLGGKGANLAEMTNIGLPVPAGFTITTEVCTWFYANDRKYPPQLNEQVAQALSRDEEV